MARARSSLARSLLALVVLALHLPPPVATAQSHFTGCAFRTAAQATVLFQTTVSVDLDGEPLGVGDEIAVFTAEGVCAGALQWQGENAALTVWGGDADTITVGEAGMKVDEPMTYRIWNASTSREYGEAERVEPTYSNRAAWLLTHGRFVPNGLYEVMAFALVPVSTEDAVLPEVASLSPNAPNPFRSRTQLTYHLPRPARVRLDIFDTGGRLVQTLVRSEQPAGSHEVVFDAQGLTSGVYFCRFAAGEAMQVRPLLLLR